MSDIEEVKPLTKKQEDAALAGVKKVLGNKISDIMEENFKDRGQLLEAQLERQQKMLGAQLAYGEISKNQPVMGALFQACMKAGRDLRGQADLIHDHMAKSVGAEVSKSINLADASEGGLLVEGTTLELWLEPLRADSVVLSLNPEQIPVTGDQFKVTGFDTDPLLFWVEEQNRSAIASTPTTGERQTAMRKALALIPVTSDYRESAAPQVLRKLEDLMRNAFRVGFDEKWITGSGQNNNIKGLRNHISENSAQTGTTLANILVDVSKALNSIESNNIPAERIGVLMAPRSKYHLMFGAVDADNKPFFLEEMRAGTWLGFPFRATTSIPTNLNDNESYVIWQAMNQFFVGMSTALDLEWFRSASFTDAGVLVSTIEQDVEILRGRQKTGTLMPHTTSGYVLTGVTWGA